jgi:hypothetical protein
MRLLPHARLRGAMMVQGAVELRRRLDAAHTQGRAAR